MEEWRFIVFNFFFKVYIEFGRELVFCVCAEEVINIIKDCVESSNVFKMIKNKK